MAKQPVDWQKQAKFGTVVLVIVLAWAALKPEFEQSYVFVVAANFLLGMLSAFAFPRRTAVAVSVALAGALLPELLQALVPLRDTRGIELVVKWLVTIGGVIFGLLVSYFLARRKLRSLR
jgi:VanZ family protein